MHVKAKFAVCFGQGKYFVFCKFEVLEEIGLNGKEILGKIGVLICLLLSIYDTIITSFFESSKLVVTFITTKSYLATKN